MVQTELLLQIVNTASSVVLTLLVVALTVTDILNPEYKVELKSLEETTYLDDSSEEKSGYTLFLQIKNKGLGYGKITEISHIGIENFEGSNSSERRNPNNSNFSVFSPNFPKRIRPKESFLLQSTIEETTSSLISIEFLDSKKGVVKKNIEIGSERNK